MQKAKREVYRILSAEIDWTLCSFCRYSHFEGSPCYEDATLECEHPLEAVTGLWDFDSPSPMEDCWGFSPNISKSDLADIVGMVLSQGWDSEKTVWWKEDNKIW